MSTREKSRLIFTLISSTENSIRKIAGLLGFSKSSVHRHKQSIEKRRDKSLSKIWETQDGFNWLHRMIIAAIFVFGLKRGSAPQHFMIFSII